MFSDFANHRLGVPQIAPRVRPGHGQRPLRRAARRRGLWRTSRSAATATTATSSARRRCETSPWQPTFFHNGCFTRLEDAIRHHLERAALAARPTIRDAAGVAADLRLSERPSQQLLEGPRSAGGRAAGAEPTTNSTTWCEFVRTGLLDERATPERLLNLVPRRAAQRPAAARVCAGRLSLPPLGRSAHSTLSPPCRESPPALGLRACGGLIPSYRRPTALCVRMGE